MRSAELAVDAFLALSVAIASFLAAKWHDGLEGKLACSPYGPSIGERLQLVATLVMGLPFVAAWYTFRKKGDCGKQMDMV